MIVVATADFEVYHDVVGELKDRDVAFTTIEWGESLPEGTSVLVTGASDDPDRYAAPAIEQVRAEPGDPRWAVETALSTLREEGDRTVIGVDPGARPGVAVVQGETVVAAFHVPLADAAEVVRREVEDDPEAIVRIGDGARLQGARIVEAIDGVRVELVDETGTTPSLGTGTRGMGDVLAAVNIARRKGEPIDSREIEPSDGEIRVIQDRSRERSDENREIDAPLARRVALGELTLDEAIEEHRER
ncbi:RuvC family protein [Natronorarus salvus]|uniref:hypothetical protein n=1 Tax=Natronorarus salvus TaxID=3117733 RepID=UPI002F260354